MLGELSDQELLIIGYGASGRELGRRAAAFGMRISAADLEAPDDPMLARSGRAADLSGILEHADFVSLHLPISVETTHLVDAAFLRRMKRSAVLINVARGRLVDERALVEALRAGTLRGAGLDVFESEPLRAEHPLQSLDNVVLTPHVAGMTRSTSRRRAAIAVENALLVADGRPAKYVVRVTRVTPDTDGDVVPGAAEGPDVVQSGERGARRRKPLLGHGRDARRVRDRGGGLRTKTWPCR